MDNGASEECSFAALLTSTVSFYLIYFYEVRSLYYLRISLFWIKIVYKKWVFMTLRDSIV